MLYFLFKNNIQTGPFSKQSLLQQGLKPTDLIKLEGESQWHSADSYVEIKELLAGTHKPKFIITADKELIEIKDEKQKERNIHTDPIKPNTDPIENKTDSPFKRTPSALPKKKTSVEIHPSPAIHRPERKEVIAESSGSTPKVPVQKIASLEQAPQIKKRSQPIPRVAEKTVSQAKSNFLKEVALPILIIGAIGFIFYFGFKKFTNQGPENLSAITPIIDSTQNKLNRDSLKSSNISVAKKEKAHRNSDSLIAIAKKDSINLAKKKMEDSVNKANKNMALDASSGDSLALTAKKVSDNEKESTVTKLENAQAPVSIAPKNKKTSSSNNSTGKTKQNSTEKPVAKSSVKQKSIKDYVNLSLNKTIDKEVRNIKLRVSNISDQALNIAVIEVKYFDANGNFVKGETLQAENIAPGKTVNIKIPNDKAASKLSYKASLISGDNVYMMAN